MRTHQLFFAVLLGVLIGCATSYVTQSQSVTAQPGPSGFRECVSYTMNADHDFEDLAENAKPIGNWTPVGGTQSSVILCR